MVEIYNGQKIYIIEQEFLGLSSPFDLPVFESKYEIYINNRKISKRVKELAKTRLQSATTDIVQVYLDIARELIDEKIYSRIDE